MSGQKALSRPPVTSHQSLVTEFRFPARKAHACPIGPAPYHGAVTNPNLVTELQAGSETAFDWLVTHYHAPVFNLILGMLGDPSDAADGTQEVFLKAFKGIRSFRQGSSLKTWLYRIAIREALNHRRWFKRHLQKNVSIDAEPEEGQAQIEIEDLHATPFDQLASREIQAVVQGALRQIPDVFRSAVILRDLEGLSYEEVAEVLECSVGTVKSRILRGRRALKDLLDPLLVEHHAPHHAATHSTQHVFCLGPQEKDTL